VFYLWSIGKLNFIHIHMQSVLRFFKKLYFSSNSVLKVLSKVSCNQKYCQQFLKQVDVALDQSKWHIDVCLGTSRTLHLSSFFFFFSYFLYIVLLCCLCFCLGRINVSYLVLRGLKLS